MTALEGAKARGAFFTPSPIAQYITRWALEGSGGRVLEPASGEAAFLLAAAEVGGPQWHLDGVELHPESAEAARAVLRETGIRATVTTANFFGMAPTGDYDAVIGNPPYVRYHRFTGADRVQAQAAALRAGVALGGMASSWAAFTVHASGFLRPGGRLGLVLPAELLSVNYAGPVRRHLLESFARVRLVAFTERVFPGVAADIVLVLAEGFGQAGKSDRLETLQLRNAADLAVEAPFETFQVTAPEQKWTSALLASDPLRAYDELLAGPDFGVLGDWGKVGLGIVTGSNDFFALTPARVAELGLGTEDLLPLSPPGSAHLRRLQFTAEDRAALGQLGSATWLFRPWGQRTPAAVSYVRAGEKRGVNNAYKCRIRSPWWRVRLITPPDLLLTCMNADAARLVANTARAHHLNSVHGVHLFEGPDRELALELLPLATLGTATLLGAETVGRSYGAGLLKLEPSEAQRLPVPTPELLRAKAPALREVRGPVAAALERSQLPEAVRLVDEALGLPAQTVEHLRHAHAHLQRRRKTRGSRA